MFFNTVIIKPQTRYASVLLITSISLLYIFLQLILSNWKVFNLSLETAKKITYIREFIPPLYLPAIPLLVKDLIPLTPRSKRLNRLLTPISGFYLVIAAIITAINPGLFKVYQDPLIQIGSYDISITFTMGPLGILTELWLALLMIYMLTIITSQMIKERFRGESRYLFLGSLISYYYFFSAMAKNELGRYPPPLPELTFSRMTIGLSLFTFFTYLAIFRTFVKKSRETEEAKSNLAKERQNLLTMAFQDPITHIANRTSFLSELKNFINSGNKGVLITMDIDGFSQFNESYGSIKGDQLLQILAQRFDKNLPDFVKSYRTGSDEFSFLITSITHQDTAREISILLHNWLRQGVVIDEEIYRVNASLGYVYIPQQADNIHGAVTNCYRALNRSKDSRLPFVNYKREHRIMAETQIALIRKLRKSIDEKDFYLVYQPTVNRYNDIIQAEVLVRWRQEDPGYELPSFFLPLVEKAGVMQDLGSLIIKQFIEDYEYLHPKSRNIRFSINLSESQVFSLELSDNLIYQLNKQSIPLRSVQFEIPESVLLTFYENHKEEIDEYKLKGISIGVDNFGSFLMDTLQFRNYPVDIVKLDTGLTRNIPDDPMTDSLIQMVMNFSELCDVQICAKNVENQTQYQYLKDKGIELFQGFFISSPLTKEELLKRLQ